MSLGMTQAQVTDTSNKIKQIQTMLQAVNEAADLMDSIKSGERNLSKISSDLKNNAKKLETSQEDVKKAEKVVANARVKAKVDMEKLATIHSAALDAHSKTLTERLMEHNKSVAVLEETKKKLSASVKEKTAKIITLEKQAATLSSRINEYNAQMDKIISNIKGQ